VYRFDGMASEQAVEAHKVKVVPVTKDLLKKVYEGAIKALEQGWTQGAMARAESGEPTDAFNKTACSFCSMGALHRGIIDMKDEVYVDANDLVAPLGLGKVSDLSKWNDDPARTQDEVLALFRKVKAEIELV
jgi:hypothetical protein